MSNTCHNLCNRPTFPGIEHIARLCKNLRRIEYGGVFANYLLSESRHDLKERDEFEDSRQDCAHRQVAGNLAENCTHLTSISIANFEVGSVEDVVTKFSTLTNLTELDLPLRRNLDTFLPHLAPNLVKLSIRGHCRTVDIYPLLKNLREIDYFPNSIPAKSVAHMLLNCPLLEQSVLRLFTPSSLSLIAVT